MSKKRWAKKKSYKRKIKGKTITVRAHNQRYSNDSQPNQIIWKKHGVIEYTLNKNGSLKAIRLTKDQANILARGIVDNYNQRTSKFRAFKSLAKAKAKQKFNDPNVRTKIQGIRSDVQTKIDDSNFQNKLSQFRSQIKSQSPSNAIEETEEPIEQTPKAKVTLGGFAGAATGGIAGEDVPDTIPELIVTEAVDFVPIWSSITGLYKFITTKRNRALYGIEIIPIVNILPTDTIIYVKGKGKDVKLSNIRQLKGKRFSRTATIVNSCPSCGNDNSSFYQLQNGMLVCFLCRKGTVPTQSFRSYIAKSSLPEAEKQRMSRFADLVDRSNADIMESSNQQNFSRVFYYNNRVRGQRFKDSSSDQKQVKTFEKYFPNPEKLDMKYVDDKLPKEFKFHKEVKKNAPLSLISVQDKKGNDLAWIEFIYQDNMIVIMGHFQTHPSNRPHVSGKFKRYDLRLYILREIVNLSDSKELDIMSRDFELSKMLETFGSNMRGRVRLPHV
jgi:hypothetical protein